MDPIDIVILSHNRLEYLERAVDALEARTPEPFRLTIVDNASGADVRNWLASNRRRFERVISLPRNEHVAAFQHGIDTTTSDPFIVTDPDLVVPQLQPSWLARLTGLMDRNPDLGLIGASFEHQVPPGFDAEVEIVDADVGTWFQLIRRDALREPYVKDNLACRAVRAAGYRAGWTPTVVVEHLGAHDASRYPAHLAAKNAVVERSIARDEVSPYPFYWANLDVIPRPPTLSELALAAPVAAEIRAAEIPPASVLELTWSAPSVAAVFGEATALEAPSHVRLEEGAAGAVVVVTPPRVVVDEVLAEAFRVAAKLVVVVADLETIGGRMADELAPGGWRGFERPAVDSIVREVVRLGDELAALRSTERFTTIQHRDEWLSFFAAGAFGSGPLRAFVFRREAPLPVPDAVRGGEELPRWRPPPRPEAPPRSLFTRVLRRGARALRRFGS